MSLPREEAAALDAAFEFLLALGSGRTKVTGRISEVRAEARSVLRHYPLAAGYRWLGDEGDR